LSEWNGFGKIRSPGTKKR